MLALGPIHASLCIFFIHSHHKLYICIYISKICIFFLHLLWFSDQILSAFLTMWTSYSHLKINIFYTAILIAHNKRLFLVTPLFLFSSNWLVKPKPKCSFWCFPWPYHAPSSTLNLLPSSILESVSYITSIHFSSPYTIICTKMHAIICSLNVRINLEK